MHCSRTLVYWIFYSSRTFVTSTPSNSSSSMVVVSLSFLNLWLIVVGFLLYLPRHYLSFVQLHILHVCSQYLEIPPILDYDKHCLLILLHIRTQLQTINITRAIHDAIFVLVFQPAKHALNLTSEFGIRFYIVHKYMHQRSFTPQ